MGKIVFANGEIFEQFMSIYANPSTSATFFDAVEHLARNFQDTDIIISNPMGHKGFGIQWQGGVNMFGGLVRHDDGTWGIHT